MPFAPMYCPRYGEPDRRKDEAISLHVRDTFRYCTVRRYSARFRIRACNPHFHHRDPFKRHAAVLLWSLTFSIYWSQDNGTSYRVIQVGYLWCESDQVHECSRLDMKGHVIRCCCVPLKGGISSCISSLILITPAPEIMWNQPFAKYQAIKSSCYEVDLPREMTYMAVRTTNRSPSFMQRKSQDLIGYALQQPPVRLGTTVQPPAPILTLTPG